LSCYFLNVILHRGLLVNLAFTPIYNHVFMALSISSNHTDELQKAVLKMLWTRQLDGQTKQKRRLVARKRLGAGLEMGGWVFNPLKTRYRVLNKISYKKSTEGLISQLPGHSSHAFWTACYSVSTVRTLRFMSNDWARSSGTVQL
jgi:hypothetical protein